MEVAGSVVHKARRTTRQIMIQKRQQQEAASKWGAAIVEMGKR